MVKIIYDKSDYDSLRVSGIQYDYNNENDKKIMQEIEKLMDKLQPTCFNCEHYYLAGSFGGYMASMCDIYECLEYFGNPHNDCDGSKCKDYRRKNDKTFTLPTDAKPPIKVVLEGNIETRTILPEGKND